MMAANIELPRILDHDFEGGVLSSSQLAF